MASYSWIGVVIVILTCGISHSDAVRRIRNHKGRMTKIACEGETLNITCPTGHLISIIRANYGRFSLLECNERNEAYDDVQCMYAMSTRVMEERCGNRMICMVNATNHVFGDSCPNVDKYLEVQYDCIADRNATTVSATHAVTTSTTGATTTSTSASVPASPAKQTTVQRASEKPSFCPETEKRGLVWPTTRVNHPARVTCPNNADGAYGEWWCSANGEWILDNPDLSRCVSPWARQLDIRSSQVEPNSASTKDAVVTIAGKLQSDTRSNPLYGGDTSVAVNVMQRLVDTVTASRDQPSIRKMDFLKELNKHLIQTGSNLLQEERRTAWLDLPPTNQTGTADGLINAVEDAVVIVAKELNDPTASTVHLVSPKITVEANRVQIIQDYIQFPSPSLYDNRFDNIQLPRAALEQSGSGEWAKVVFVSYDSLLGEYMKPDPTIVTDQNGAEIAVERRIVSRLMSANIVKMNHDSSQFRPRTDVATVGQLKQPVYANFALKNVDENMSNPMCVYWRRTDSKWSPNGCSIRKSNQTHVSCACNHLTTFAVLMDIRGLQVEPLHQLTLSFITCIGCVISIFSCAAAIVAFCCFSGPHYTDRITIHKNLCFCLLIAESVFLFGIAQTDHRLACSVIAGLLHYFFLAAFAWMLLEGFQLYSLLIEVFEAERSRKPFFYLFGYGMPAVIVGISLLVDHNSYGTRRHCWLNTENYFVFSFVGPVSAVLAANVVFLVMALVVMCRHASFVAAHRHDASKSTMANGAVWLKGATILIILLGLTWAFGLVYINGSTLIMSYLFTCLNSLQGFFIFVFHVLMNEKVRKEWNKWLARYRGRPPTWIRTPPDADYKPSKPRIDEPMLIGVIRTTESDQVTPLRIESPSLLSKLFGSQRQRNEVRGSIGHLLLVQSGSMNSRKTCDYPYASYSCSSDIVTNSDLMVESPCSRYCLNRPPPPNFPPPSLPRHSPCASRRTVPVGAIPVQFVTPRFTVFERPSADEGHIDDQRNHYASTDAYFPTDSERPDSGYSGSAHHCTPPPVPCNDKDTSQLSPSCNSARRQKKQRTRNADLNYEVPVHASNAHCLHN